MHAKLHAEASSLRGQLDTANRLLAAPDKPALDSALHNALQVCRTAATPPAKAAAVVACRQAGMQACRQAGLECVANGAAAAGGTGSAGSCRRYWSLSRSSVASHIVSRAAALLLGCLPLQDLSDQNKHLTLQLAEAHDAQSSLK